MPCLARQADVTTHSSCHPAIARGNLTLPLPHESGRSRFPLLLRPLAATLYNWGLSRDTKGLKLTLDLSASQFPEVRA